LDKKFIDLKTNLKYIEQYIELRNQYSELLLTKKVNYKETLEWLKIKDIEIYGIVEDDILKGVIILYINKGNELTFFVKEKQKGYGTILLKYMEEIAIKKNIKQLYAWVLEKNIIASKVFEKNGYKETGTSIKIFDGKKYKGYIYKKNL